MPPSPSLSARMTRAHVGERDDDHDRPEDQRHDAVDVLGVERHRVGIVGAEYRLDGVDRAGSDIAEHHAERGEDDGRPDRLPGIRLQRRSLGLVAMRQIDRKGWIAAAPELRR